MRVLHKCSLSVALVAMAAQAYAAAQFTPAAYAGAGLGRASVSSKYVDDSNDISFNALLGYQATPNLGIEAYTRSLSFNPFRGLLSDAGYYPDQHYGLAVVGTAPLDEHFSIYGRLGVGSTKLHSTRTSIADKHETDPLISAGASYSFNNNWSVNMDLSRLTKSEVNLISTGLRYQF